MEKRDLKEKILEWLGIRTDPELREYMDHTNMRAGLYVGIMVAVSELAVAISAIPYSIRHVSEFNRTQWLITHLTAYIGLMLISTYLAVYSYQYLKGKSRNHVASVTAVTMFGMATVLFGAFITYGSFEKHGHIFFFVASVFSIAGLFVYNPIFTIVFIIGSFVGFEMFLERMMVAPFPPGVRVNYYSTLFALLVLGISHYNERRFSSKNQLSVRRMSLYDSLTGVKNLRSFEFDTEKSVNKLTYMLVCDVDDFKYFNDQFGHHAGDHVLKEIVKMALEGGPKKEVYRMNGDEITIVSYETNLPDITAWANDWMKRVRKIEWNGYALYLNLSIGIVYGVPESEAEVLTMRTHADRKMYEAKREGGARIASDSLENALIEAERGENLNKVYKATDADPLTGLPSIHLFRERAKQQMVQMDKDDEPYVLVWFDIVNFKSYNEKYGFQGGDQLLKTIGMVIQDSFKEALVSRFSDDHFVVLCSTDDLIENIETVRHSVHSLQQDTHLETKAGIYQPEKDETNVSIACDRAKLVCDNIKNNYEQHYKYYDENIYRELKKKQYIIDTIDEAVRKGYIEVYYQPVVRSMSGELCGVEALARWNDPEIGYLEPKDFIESLEQNRLIYKLDLHVVKCICRDLKTLRDAGCDTVPVSLNLSRLDFELCDVVGAIEEAMDEYGVPKDMLHVEITESALIDNTDFLKQEVDRIRDNGLEVWMDDFGSGYSSLNTLQDYNFDVIKIDMIFLKNYSTSLSAREILASVVNMCKRIGIRTLAEGVETEEQMEFLKNIGCEKLQGFLFDRPIRLHDLWEKLENKELVMENRKNRDYYDTIGRVNVLSQTPMEYFDAKLRGAATELYSGTPLAIAECYQKNEFRYLMANDKYYELMSALGRERLEDSSMYINNLSREMKDRFIESVAESKRRAKAIPCTFSIDGKEYLVYVRFIASLGERDAVILLMSEGTLGQMAVF